MNHKAETIVLVLLLYLQNYFQEKNYKISMKQFVYFHHYLNVRNLVIFIDEY